MGAIREDGALSGMGTTVVGLLLEGSTVAVAHVGDSRAYRLRDGRLDQLTQDHTWVHEQVMAGFLSKEQARSHPLKNVVTRALGGEKVFLDDVEVTDELLQRIIFECCTLHAGQACISAKRFIVAESIADEFETKLAESVGSLVVGDPTDPATQVGPLARPDLVDTLREQVEESIAAGAEALVGGFEHDGPGTFVDPLVLTGNPWNRPAARLAAPATTMRSSCRSTRDSRITENTAAALVRSTGSIRRTSSRSVSRTCPKAAACSPATRAGPSCAAASSKKAKARAFRCGAGTWATPSWRATSPGGWTSPCSWRRPWRTTR